MSHIADHSGHASAGSGTAVSASGPQSDATTAPLVALIDASLSINGKTILSDVNISVGAGEIVTLVGPNGSGKTSLLRILIGAIKPTRGRVQKKASLRLGYVPQKLHIDENFPISVTRFLNLPVKRPAREIKAALSTASIEHLEHTPVSRVSGGQLQRVLLARALLDSPDLLVLDEPTQGLDQAGSAAFYRQLEVVREKLGCAVLLVSHELHVVMSASDRVVCLNGHVCCHGTPDVVASAPEYRALFGSGTQGALALYRHDHDHDHNHTGSDHSHG